MLLHLLRNYASICAPPPCPPAGCPQQGLQQQLRQPVARQVRLAARSATPQRGVAAAAVGVDTAGCQLLRQHCHLCRCKDREAASGRAVGRHTARRHVQDVVTHAQQGSQMQVVHVALARTHLRAHGPPRCSYPPGGHAPSPERCPSRRPKAGPQGPAPPACKRRHRRGASSLAMPQRSAQNCDPCAALGMAPKAQLCTCSAGGAPTRARPPARLPAAPPAPPSRRTQRLLRSAASLRQTRTAAAGRGWPGPPAPRAAAGGRGRRLTGAERRRWRR